MIYWICTGLVATFLTLSALSYLWHQPTMQGIRDLGFPDFFRIQLAVLKLLAIPALIMPGLPAPVREWAYAGVALFLLTAMVAHYAHGDPIALNLLNLVLMALLVVSYLHLPK